MSFWLPRHYALLLVETPVWGILLAHDITQRALTLDGLHWVIGLGVSHLFLSTGAASLLKPLSWSGLIATHGASLILSFLFAHLLSLNKIFQI
ncbi:MAG: hypothetical protein CMO31_02985 [Trueperaceae bacterium]|nr:hypothetical protein [Trueperaceae bacterium]MCH2667646.1 hypothetical protein [Deinococcales bacterium]